MKLNIGVDSITNLKYKVGEPVVKIEYKKMVKGSMKKESFSPKLLKGENSIRVDAGNKY
jgi:KaiC/GvpD/RAD55 family RecA-like ATPase